MFFKRGSDMAFLKFDLDILEQHLLTLAAPEDDQEPEPSLVPGTLRAKSRELMP